jgi:hypothetical protein
LAYTSHSFINPSRSLESYL